MALTWSVTPGSLLGSSAVQSNTTPPTSCHHGSDEHLRVAHCSTGRIFIMNSKRVYWSSVLCALLGGCVGGDRQPEEEVASSSQEITNNLVINVDTTGCNTNVAINN